MKRYVDTGLTLRRVLGSGETTVKVDDPYLMGDLLTVVDSLSRPTGGGMVPVLSTQASAQGDIAVLAVKGKYIFPKASGAITLGAVVYWDDTAKNITTTASTNKIAGWAASAQASGDTTIEVLLKG